MESVTALHRARQSLCLCDFVSALEHCKTGLSALGLAAAIDAAPIPAGADGVPCLSLADPRGAVESTTAELCAVLVQAAHELSWYTELNAVREVYRAGHFPFDLALMWCVRVCSCVVLFCVLRVLRARACDVYAVCTVCALVRLRG